MTLTAFDHDYWRAQRDDWSARGLHWHCYSWSGPGPVFAQDGQRRDPATELPPLIVREWLSKPSRVLRQSPKKPEDAVAWLTREFERAVAPELEASLGITREIRFGRALHDLQCGLDLSWAFWVGGASSIVSMAVVGTSECRLH